MTNKIDIKVELKARKITQTDIAKMLKVSVVSVNDVISKKRKTPRIRKAISMAIGKPESEVWPETNTKEAA